MKKEQFDPRIKFKIYTNIDGQNTYIGYVSAVDKSAAITETRRAFKDLKTAPFGCVHAEPFNNNF